MKHPFAKCVLACVLAGAAPLVAFAQAATAPVAAAPVAASAAEATAPAAMRAAPAGFVAPAEPKADDTNAARGKSQPGNNAPMWRGVRDTGAHPGYSSNISPEAGTLIQGFTKYPGANLATAGESWRQARNGWILPYGGALLFIVALAIALFYWSKGPLGGLVPDTGRKVERFTPLERSAHWVNAGAFVVLAVSGLVMAFGKFILLPIIGGTLFGWLTYALKTAHNFAGPLFAVSLVVVIVTFIRDNFPKAGDLTWLLKGGGMLSEHEIPSHRFNAGEKIVFWGGVLLLGGVVVGSGLVMDKLIPDLEYSRAMMQVANMVHAVSTVLMMCMFMGHIYLGTVGTRGAYDGMRTGYVDEAWAEEHHSLWLKDIQAGKIPAQRSALPGASLNPEARPQA